VTLHQPPQLTIHMTAAEVARLDLRPGDRLVLRCERDLGPEAWYCLSEQCRKLFPGHEVIVLPHDMHLAAIREGEPLAKFRELF
jgi:hypothetical protein